MTILGQPGGAKTMSDADLEVLAMHCRRGLAAAEQSKRRHKARRGWADSLEAVETERAARGTNRASAQRH